MELPKELVQEFTSVFVDKGDKKLETSCYGTAKINTNSTTGEEETFIILDGSDIETPATYTVAAKTGDRVLAILKNRKALVIGNITNPVIIVGTLKANDKIVVAGCLTTNESRVTYNDTTHNGLTFSAGGIGAHSSSGDWWLKDDGTFQFGGTNGIKYANNKVTLGSDVVLTWNSISDAPTGVLTTSNYTGTITKTYIDSLNVIAQNISGVTLTGKTISGGEIKIGTPSNNVYPFQVSSTGALNATDATISGAITATSLTLANGVKVPASTGVSGLATVATSGNYNDLSNKVDTSVFISVANDGTISIQKNNGTAKAGTVTKTYGTTTKGFSISTNGLLEASNAVIYGSIYASTGTIGGWSITSGKLSKTTNNITEGNDTVTYEAYMQGYNGTPGGGNTAFGIHRTVGSNTTLPFAVYYDGKIHAEKGEIAGWEITANQFRKTTSTVTEGGQSVTYMAFIQGLNGTPDNTTGAFGIQRTQGSNVTYPFRVSYGGELTAVKGRIAGWSLDNDMIFKSITIDGTVYQPWLYAPASPSVSSYAFFVRKQASGASTWSYPFAVCYDGTLHATGAHVSGEITASSGKIGNWNIGATSGTGQLNGSLYSGTFGAANSIYLIPGGTTTSTTIAGRAGTDWVLSAGANFGVTKSGALYASEANFYTNSSNELLRFYNTSNTLLGNLEVDDQDFNRFHCGDNGWAFDSSYKATVTVNTTLDGAGSLGLSTTNSNSSKTCSVTIYPDGVSITRSSSSPVSINTLNLLDSNGNTSIPGTVTFTKTADVALLKSTYNGSTYNLIRNHNNGNISISASGSGLYLGYENTTFVNLLNGKLSLNSQGQLTAANSIYAINTNGTAVVARLNADGTGNGIYMQCLSDGSVKITSRGANDTWYDILSRSNNSNAITTSGLWSFTSLGGYSGYVPVSTTTDGKRALQVETIDSTTLHVYGQWGTTGTTYGWRNINATTSDIRLKDHIKDSTVNALNVVNSIKIRSFDWKDSKEHWKIGMIADEIELLDSNLAVGGGYDENGSMDAKTINSLYLTGYLVKAIQELYTELKKLKGAA